MKSIIFDYIELINTNFYKIVFKPFVCDDFILDNILNLIRQSLFINTSGFSVSEISINGIKSEYGYIFGLKEDVLNLILNIRGLVFKLKKKKKVILHIKNSKKSIIKGFDINYNKYTKILNPDHVICHLDNNTNLNLFIKVVKGKGYIPFNSDPKYRNYKIFKNGILIDSYFSPIIKVSYLVKKIDNFLYKNVKKIIFFIETNGSVNVKKSIINSINSLFSYFSNFIFLEKKFFFNYYNIRTPIFDSGLSFRTIKYLNNYGILNLNDLLKCNKFNIFNNNSLFTKKTILEIKNILKYYDLSYF